MADVFGVLGVLLVFVIAYFTALLPQVDELLQRPGPVEADLREALAARLGAYRKLTGGFLVLVALVGMVLYPLSDQVLRQWSFHWPFPASRSGLLVVDVCLLGIFLAGLRLIQRISRGIQVLRTPPAVPGPAR